MGKTSKHGFGSGFDSVMGAVRRFIADTVAELRRCTWPDRKQLFESTLLVMVATLVLALFVAGVDEVAKFVISLITVGNN
jgi:preprotein translocase subunit SecE